MKLDGAIIGLGVATGVAMGLVTSLVGLTPALEPLIWLAFYAAWLRAMHVRHSPSPQQTAVSARLASGVAVGVVQAALMPWYVASNPWYADYMTGDRLSMGGQVLVQGIGMGMLFGLPVGFMARGLARSRDEA